MSGGGASRNPTSVSRPPPQCGGELLGTLICMQDEMAGVENQLRAISEKFGLPASDVGVGPQPSNPNVLSIVCELRNRLQMVLSRVQDLNNSI